MSQFLESSFQCVGSALDIVQSLLKLRTDAEILTKTNELRAVIYQLQRELMTVHSSYSAVVAREHALKEEIAALKDWSQEKQRYEPCELSFANLVYRVKPSENGMEPLHYLCANCYDNHVKSVLTRNGERVGSHQIFSCSKCGAKLVN